MYQLYRRQNFADDSPFQFARMTWLTDRIKDNFKRYLDLRATSTGRMDSSHLLSKILLNLNVEFKGDLDRYVQGCETAAKRLCGPLGLTSASSKGRLWTQGVFYPGCPEIIVYGRTGKWTTQDLWRDWRSVAPVEVVCHPITSTNIVELGVMNEIRIPKPDLAIISIDIPLLAAQWKLWQSANPGKNIENFLTTVVMVAFQRSHLNVAFWNRLMALSDIKPYCDVDTNLPFGQMNMDAPSDEILKDVVVKTANKSMGSNQMLSTVPVFFGSNYLDEVILPELAPTAQVLWALTASKMEQAAYTLNIGKVTGYNRLAGDLNVIRRTIRQESQDKFLSNGLTQAAAEFLHERFDRLVVDNLPA